MSHIVTLKTKFLDLDALKQACPDLGLEFRENQRTYNWFGKSVGDYPLPAGFTKEDLGKCNHAIAVKDASSNTYEIGVVANKNGEGYTLLWDFWQGGYGLEAKVGKNASKLVQGYKVEVAIKELRRQGRRVRKTYTDSGDVVLRAQA